MTDEQSTYTMLRDQLVAQMIEFRSATHERDLIERMIRDHEIVRRNSPGTQLPRAVDPHTGGRSKRLCDSSSMTPSLDPSRALGRKFERYQDRSPDQDGRGERSG
jgi:hypothetical protein